MSPPRWGALTPGEERFVGLARIQGVLLGRLLLPLLVAALAACNSGLATPSVVPAHTPSSPDGATATTATIVPTIAGGASTPVTAPVSKPRATPEMATALGTWRGLVVAPEHRCSQYDSDDYPYPRSVEQRIVASMGGIVYSPYTGTWFNSPSETDIEHIVARSEAHDSGLCAADDTTRRRFASDLLNLTLASPAVNRSQKSGKDAAEWLPGLNRCWFGNRVVEVRSRYSLTIDQRERDVLEGVLAGCTSTEMVIDPSATLQLATPSLPQEGGGGDALLLYDDNRNGRITCAEARRHGIAPVARGHPAYPYMDDRDNDGVVCE